MTQEQIEQELQEIDNFIKTPVAERPKYKNAYEQVKRKAELRQPLRGEPKWLAESKEWQLATSMLQQIQEEESKEYLCQASIRSRDLFRRYAESLKSETEII